MDAANVPFILGWAQVLGNISAVALPVVAVFNVMTFGKLNVSSDEYRKGR